MSPEQAAGLDADERSDIYSLCVLLYELLTLRHYLGDRESVTEVIQGVITFEPPSPLLVRNRHQPPPPADLTHFLKKGMAKSPADRFQSVREMIERLRARQDGLVPIQCPLTFARRGSLGLTRFIDRHPHAVVLAMAGAAASSLGGLIYGAVQLLTG